MYLRIEKIKNYSFKNIEIRTQSKFVKDKFI